MIAANTTETDAAGMSNRLDKIANKPPVSFIILLGTMSAVPAVTTDMYLPSLPQIATDLGTTMSGAQTTITIALIGGAIGQLLVGTLSDKYGRKKPLIIGLLVHILTSICCVVLTSYVPFLLVRVLQGIGNAAASVTAMAIIQDLWDGAYASRMISRLVLVLGISPILSPIAGVYIAGIWGWRAVFIFLAGAGLVLLILVWQFLPETLPAKRRINSGNKQTFAVYSRILRDHNFLVLVTIPALLSASFMTFLTASPFALSTTFGVENNSFALVFSVLATGFIAGSQLNAAIVLRWRPLTILRAVAIIEIFLVIWLLLVSQTGKGNLIGFMVPMWFILAGIALMTPNATALALTRHRDSAGSASALLGCLQPLTAGLLAPIVGLVGNDVPVMSGAIGICIGLAILISLAYGLLTKESPK